MTEPAFRSLSQVYADHQAKKPPVTPYPHLRNFHAILMVAFTTLIMAYSGLFGIYPILLLYVMWFGLVLNKGAILIKPSSDMLLICLFPAVCCLSAAWSAVPWLTIYSGIEYFSMIICVIIMSRAVNIEAFAKGISLGAALVLVVALFSGSYGRDALSGGYALVGYFGSKNTTGIFAEIGLFTSFAIFFSKMKRIDKILFAICPLGISTVSLYLSHSGASVLSLAMALAIIFAAYLVTRFPGRFRFFAFGASAVTILAITAAVLLLGIHEDVLEGMGKDSSLTGRTHLWTEGMKIGMDSPVLGHGYGAFWVQGNPQAERFWYEFRVESRMGFHFHNLFVQTFVDLGGVGLLLIIWLVAASCIKSNRALLKGGMGLENTFLMGLSIIFLIRSWVEVDFLVPFGIGPLLFFCILPRLAILKRGGA